MGGGGGGVNLTPPAWNPRLPRNRHRSQHALFVTFFFQVLRIFWYQICENRTIGREVTWRFVLARRPKNLPKIRIFAYVCVQNTWKLLIFLKCTKIVFILSLGPLAQIFYISELIMIKLQKIKNHKNNEIHKK